MKNLPKLHKVTMKIWKIFPNFVRKLAIFIHKKPGLGPIPLATGRGRGTPGRGGRSHAATRWLWRWDSHHITKSLKNLWNDHFHLTRTQLFYSNRCWILRFEVRFVN